MSRREQQWVQPPMQQCEWGGGCGGGGCGGGGWGGYPCEDVPSDDVPAAAVCAGGADYCCH
jgi:hypothetical protein